MLAGLPSYEPQPGPARPASRHLTEYHARSGPLPSRLSGAWAIKEKSADAATEPPSPALGAETAFPAVVPSGRTASGAFSCCFLLYRIPTYHLQGSKAGEAGKHRSTRKREGKKSRQQPVGGRRQHEQITDGASSEESTAHGIYASMLLLCALRSGPLVSPVYEAISDLPAAKWAEMRMCDPQDRPLSISLKAKRPGGGGRPSVYWYRYLSSSFEHRRPP